LRKWIFYSIPIFTLIIFVAIMQGGYYYITSLSNKNDIPQYIERLNNDLKYSHWDTAREDLQHLDVAWKKAVPRLQFHAEMDAIDSIKADLARLSGSIDAQDLEGALPELRELAEHWENLKN
jgi:hypothetical protein